MTMDPEIEQFRNEAQIDQQKLPNAVERVRQGGALKPLRLNREVACDVRAVAPRILAAAPRRVPFRGGPRLFGPPPPRSDHCRRAE